MNTVLSNELIRSLRDVPWQIENLYILVVFIAIGVLLVVILQVLNLFSSRITEKKDFEPTSVIIKPPHAIHASCQRNKKIMKKPQVRTFRSNSGLRIPIEINARTPRLVNNLVPLNRLAPLSNTDTGDNTCVVLKADNISDSDKLNSSVKTTSSQSSITSDIRNSKPPAVVMMKGPMTSTKRENDTNSEGFIEKRLKDNQTKALNATQSISAESSDNEDSSENQEDPSGLTSAVTDETSRRVTEV
ncbi:unnamed protein product [Auanema sp. JU1783]|nr:unnamed protein product [Auanema sp. JU1783]